jgi:CCR4-NOT transcriptional regulation complex NOT5 subunit
MVLMKSKKKAKTRSKSKSRTKSKVHAKGKTHARTGTNTAHSAIVESIPSANVTLTPPLKTCQEVEVGDIGGFGSPDELEEHEKRCSEAATEFCSNCGKNLCHNHYDLIHRDHDTTGDSTSSSLAQQ